jgi:hypothetical protein
MIRPDWRQQQREIHALPKIQQNPPLQQGVVVQLLQFLNQCGGDCVHIDLQVILGLKITELARFGKASWSVRWTGDVAVLVLLYR